MNRASGEVFDATGRDGPLRAPGTPVARPRAAATLILLDRTAGPPRVMMGRRHRGHDFMPDKWVFPGGRVDRADFRAPAARELTPETAAALASTLPANRPGLPRALAVAAVRETWEEAGLALGEPGPSGAGPLADLSALEVLARAVTPPYRPKRFDAAFFTADAARLRSRERAAGSGELDELDWFPLPRARELDLPAVTRFVLEELGRRLDDPSRPPLYLRFRGRKHLATPFGE